MIEVENMDPLSARVFAALHRTIHLHQQLVVRELAKEGSNPGEVFCLRVLLKHDGITQRDLAEHLHVSRPWITRTLQGLEKAGAVARCDDEHDQRLTRVFITERGRERERELRETWGRYLNETIGTLTDEEKVELERLLDKLRDSLLGETSAAGEADEKEVMA